MNRSCALLAFVFALAAPRPAIVAEARAVRAWSYQKGDHDPQHWGDLNPGFEACRTGRHQSPIDIRGAKKADMPAVKFSYAPTAFRIVDDGHSVQVNVAPGNYIVVGGIQYDLVEVHFHRPAEERIEGQRFSMAAHLVHKDLGDHLAVVAVMLNPGRPSPVLEALWKEMPREVGRERAPQGTTVDWRKLLPVSRGYYTFSGSLTTPPCTEQVTWVVLKQPVEISRTQETAFATRHTPNARPIQPINGRLIKVSR